MMKTRSVAYWTATAVLVFAVVSGGIGELLHAWGTPDTALVLGYPMYILTILGFWKLLGGIALVVPGFALVPGFARIREWAWAGIFFNMTGAAASHAFASDYGPYGFHLWVPLSLAALALACAGLAAGASVAQPRDHSLDVHRVARMRGFDRSEDRRRRADVVV
ncbi:MAG: DoxX family protein [Chloroflexi bacterium]|nr:DoxX family protein [Chloroflexota bacterium]